jgi:outer membrane receptor protein involved in Fe transport
MGASDLAQAQESGSAPEDIAEIAVTGTRISGFSVSGRGYLDLHGSYKITDNIDVFAKINNLLDVDPPATPNIISQTIYASAPFYDRTRRYYIGGVRLRF